MRSCPRKGNCGIVKRTCAREGGDDPLSIFHLLLGHGFSGHLALDPPPPWSEPQLVCCQLSVLYLCCPVLSHISETQFPHLSIRTNEIVGIVSFQQIKDPRDGGELIIVIASVVLLVIHVQGPLMVHMGETDD